jgi:hypothetical protein
MSIKIVRNDQGNCINFYGSSNPTYWNACLSGEVESSDNTLVNVKNDVKTAEAGQTQYEFFQIPFTEFRDEDNNSFANAQEVADYITLKGNVTIGVGVNYKGIWNPDTNTPDITTDVSSFSNGDFYNVTTNGTHDLGSGDIDFINGDEVIFDGTDWQHKPYAGALIEYDSTSILLNNNASVYADGAQGVEEPNGSEDGWYFKNDEAGKKINWYFLGNENAGYQMTKATLQGGYARIKVLTTMGSDSPFMSLYTTPKGDGFDAFWFRSRYSYIGDFTGIAVNQEVIVYWGDNPSVHPELTRVQLSLDSSSSLLSTAPDISTDEIYTMSLGTNSAATVDSLEFIAKELGYKNQQYLRTYLLEAKLENIVVPQNNNDLTDEVVDFKLDATSTSIMLDNGFSYGVNTIKAVDTGDGLITIKSMQGDLEHWIKLDHTNVTVGEDSVAGGLNDVINTLNELFTVGAFQSVVISDPYSTMIADVAGVVTTETGGAQGTAIETGTDEYGATTQSYNGGGYKTPETINQAGEYFTFDIRNEGIIGFGLVPSDADYTNGDYNGNASYADPSTFCNGPNSGNYGYQFSHWFHPSPNGPWTNYGANASYSMREGWSNANFAFSLSPEGAKWLAGDLVKIKVGIDENNFIVISYFDESTSLFVPIARTTYPVPNGLEYHLGIKFGDTTVRMVGIPKIHELEELAPTMNFRYVESPDGVFHYPLFATAEEAEYYDEIHNSLTAGTGSSHQHIYVDDPTNTIWYMPEASHDPTSYTYAYAPDGTETFSGNTIAYTEITTLTNADLAPPSFLDWNLTISELGAVNIAVAPADADFTTTITDNDGSGLNLVGLNIEGTAPEVTGDYTSNPSDVYTLTVTRTNSYGSTSATITLTVVNLTAPVTVISGFNHVSGTTPMIDSDTMDDGSAVHVNGNVADGERFVIEKAYIETNILPSLNATNDKYIIGLVNNPDTLGDGVALGDFDTAIVWEYETANSHTFKFYRDGVVQQNIVVGSMTQAFYDYAIEVNGTSAWLIACNINNIMNEASPADGGTFSNTYEATSIEDTAPVKIHMAVLNTTGDISTTDISTITTPTPAPANLTSWNKALDFSGSNEHTAQVSTSNLYNPLRMNGWGTTVAAPSSGQTVGNGHPWATAIVFQTPNNTSNQHIWNIGEGAGTGDDNIYLRVTGTNGNLYFGWGREGTGYNECLISNIGGSYNQSTGQWWGIYIASNGTRLSGSNATAANLVDAFDIRLMGTNDTTAFGASYDMNTNANSWTSTGARMDRSVTGQFTVGGRGSNRNFHGKVASMVVTTLRCNVAMPDATEIEMMITDPIKWQDDYKIGNMYRRPAYTSSTTNYQKNTGAGFAATQIWLMGDGTNDSYANGIRSQVYPSDQNATKLQLNSMVSNDIENVSINGLS